MKILITGGSGFIGAHLAALCVHHDHVTHICDNNSRGQADKMISDLTSRSNVEFIKKDLTRFEDVATLDKDYDIVFHLAAINGTENFYNVPFTVMEVAIESTLHMLRHFRDSTTKFVFSSSSEVYAGTVKTNQSLIPSKEDIACTIEDVTNERFSYGGSKLACELLINSYHKQYGLDYQIIRYHNIYGPRMGTKHVMPQLIKRAKDGESPFNIYGAYQTRAFCYIDDATAATLELSLLPVNGIFHIGNDLEEVQIIEVADIITEWYSMENNYSIAPAPLGSVQRRCPNISKLKKNINYAPQINLKTGIKKTIEWYNEWYASEEYQKMEKGLL